MAYLTGRAASASPKCGGQALQTLSYEDALRDKMIVGSPASVMKRLQDFELGLNGVLAELNYEGLLRNEKVVRSLQLMCEEVTPCFR
jgi:hypothetical protein